VSQIRAIMQKASQGRYVHLIDVVSRTSENIKQPTLTRDAFGYPGRCCGYERHFLHTGLLLLLVNLVAGS